MTNRKDGYSQPELNSSGLLFKLKFIMISVQSQLKNEGLPEAKAAQIGGNIDKERAETLALLKRIEPQVGMDLGEAINLHIAAMTGTKFNSVEYHYEKPVGEQ